MKKRTNQASVGNIARLAGVSTAAVSFALKNQPGVSSATRERILSIARDLGYAPDPRIDNWMARVREAKSKDLMPIAWLNTGVEEDAWRRYRFHTPYLEGARSRALELGYKVEEIWCHEPGMTMRRLAHILYQRGIDGVIVTHPARHLRLNWDCLACVAMGTSLLVPRHHRVMPDINYHLLLALKYLKRLGYRRIGICLPQEVENGSQYTVRATALALYSSLPRTERIPPLFHPPGWRKDYDRGKKTIAWLKRHKPEVVVGHDSQQKALAEAAGFRVPEDMGIVHLAVDDDVLDWAGIHSRRWEMGATAVEWLVTLIRNQTFGVPKTPLNIVIRGTWQSGITLDSRGANERKLSGPAQRESIVREAKPLPVR